MTDKQNLTPSAYKRMRSQWDALKTDNKLQEYMHKYEDAYNPQARKLVFDGTTYAYDKKKHASRKLQLAVFKHYYQHVEKTMTKYGRKKWRQRQTGPNYDLMNEQAKQYREFSSAKKLQDWYQDKLKTPLDSAEGTTLKKALGGDAGSMTLGFAKYTGMGLKGLGKVFRFKEPLKELWLKKKGLKVYLDVEFRVEDAAGKEGDFKTRTRPYTVTSFETVDSTLKTMMLELELFFHEKELYKSGLTVKFVKGMTLHYGVYKPLAGSAYLPLPDCVANTGSCVNVQYNDKYCFKYCMLCAVHKVHENPTPSAPLSTPS